MENKQQSLLDELRSQIAQRQVIVIVGAGVSMASTNNAEPSSWPGLLRNGVAYVEKVTSGLPSRWADRQRDAVASGDLDELLGVAEQIARKLGAPRGAEYQRWLRESVGSLELANRTVIDALWALRVPICTTNYDGLLESASGLEGVTWRDPSRFERVLHGDESAVLHLHGYFREPESVVLGLRSYEQVLGNAPAQALLRALRTYKTLLFVGYGAGLADPNFSAFLAWCEHVFAESHYRHFRLAKDSDVSLLQATHRPEQRIFVLGYGADHSDLAPFLRGLVGESVSVATPSTALQASPPDPREQMLADSIAAYRVHLARSPRIQRVRFADVASRAEDRDRPPAFDRLPLFVPLQLEEYARKGTPERQGGRPQSGEAESKTGVHSLLHVLAQHDNRLCLIVGGPGTGKTELGLWLLAKQGKPGEALPELSSDCVPLRVEMRLFDHDAQRSGHGYSFAAHVAEILRSSSVGLDVAQINALHQAGRLLWIFDGMDEVRAVDRRQHYAEMILALVRSAPSRAIVTSRTVGCESLVEALGQCPVYALRDFDDAQIDTFLRNWYALEFNDESELGEKRRQRLARAIAQSRTVRDLCRNPLTLTLLALLNRGDELPRRRHKIFERAIDLMVGQWDANKHLPQDESTSGVFEREDKLQFLRQLAWAMYENRWPDSQNNLIERSALQRFTVDFLKKQFNADEDRAQVWARALIDDLEERNQTLTYLGNAQYGFVHKSFLEYLAAEALLRFLTPEEQVERFGRDANDSNSWEVLTLACGLLDDQDQAPQILRILQTLLARLEYTPGSRNLRITHYAFIIRSLAEVRKLQQEPIRSLVLGLMQLTQQDVLAIARAGSGWWLDPALVEALRFFGPRWPEPDAWLQWAQRPDWKRSEKDSFTDISADVFQCVLASASQEQRIPLLIALLKKDADGYASMKALEEASLSGPWTYDEAWRLAQALETAGEEPQVSLGCHLAKEASPDIVFQLLQEPLHDRIKFYLARDSLKSSDLHVSSQAGRAVFDLTRSAIERVREFAVHWLSPTVAHDPNVRDRLKELAISEPSERVRYRAVRALCFTDEHDRALQSLVQFQQSLDPVVMSWLARDLGSLVNYKLIARQIWIRLLTSGEEYHQAEAVAELAKNHLDDESKGLIRDALRRTPSLIGKFYVHTMLLAKVDDPELTRSALAALLEFPHHSSVHSALAPHQSEVPEKIASINDYFRSLLNTDINERKRLHIAQWLYYSEQDPLARHELMRLSKDSPQVEIRLDAAEVVDDFPSLMTVARSAAKPEDRQAALWKLGWRSSQHPSIRSALLEIVRNDSSPAVRWRAVQPFLNTTQPSEQPEIVQQVILDLARQTDDEKVRLEAAQQLALYPVLLELAESGHDEKIRLRAADTLAWLDTRASLLRLGLAHRRRGRVYLSSEAVGIIEETEQGSRFFYDIDWLRRRDAEPISLTLPLQPEPYESVGVHPFFENLLPEGAYLDLVAKKTNVVRSDKFGLLLATCSDCAGAVEVRPLLRSS